MVVRSSVTLAADQRLPVNNVGGLVAFSLDGTALVYQGPSELWLRRLSDPEPQPILGTDGGVGPAISPDGATVAFVAGTSLRTVPLQGGSPVTVVRTGLSYLSSVSWGSNGARIKGCVKREATYLSLRSQTSEPG